MAKINSRRYRREVDILRAELYELSITLRSINEANPTDICIISKDDYELLEMPQACSNDNEPCFVSEEEYEQYQRALDN